MRRRVVRFGSRSLRLSVVVHVNEVVSTVSSRARADAAGWPTSTRARGEAGQNVAARRCRRTAVTAICSSNVARRAPGDDRRSQHPGVQPSARRPPQLPGQVLGLSVMSGHLAVSNSIRISPVASRANITQAGPELVMTWIPPAEPPHGPAMNHARSVILMTGRSIVARNASISARVGDGSATSSITRPPA